MSNIDGNLSLKINQDSRMNEEKTQIIESKEFMIKNDNKEYYIKIDINKKYIFFNLSISGNIVDISYENKYDLNAIIRLLNLIPSKYQDLEQVLKFIEKAYTMNKISIVKEENNLALCIKIPVGFEEEEEYRLTLYKVVLSNNEVINQIIKELNNLKKIVKNDNNSDSNIADKVNELNKRMNEKDKEIKDIYSKLKDKNFLMDEMTKNMQIKDSHLLSQDKERIENINQLKLDYEEINKKLNNQLFEIKSQLIDKDNAINEINKKIIEKDYIINEINNKLMNKEDEIKKQNYLINDLKTQLNKMNELYEYKITEIKNILLKIDEVKLKYGNILNNIPTLDESLEEKGPSLIYKKDIINTNTKGGLNCIFEVFTSIKDDQQYLVSPNKNTYNLDIITLTDEKLQMSLKGHNKKVTFVKYFLNNFKNNEYLISADESFIILTWDINNNYNIKLSIDTQYNDIIYSCLFFCNENNSYIISSTYGISDEDEKSGTKIYCVENDGKLIGVIPNSKNSSVYYLISWNNNLDKKFYIIQFSYMKIHINELIENNLYAELSQEQKLSYYSGFVYEKEDKCLLFSSTKNGYINIWDLYNKKLINNINISGNILCHIIQWDDNYAIVANYNGKSFKIIDINNFNVVKNIDGEHNKEIKSIKKIKHPQYGDSLLSAGNDHVIKLWCLLNNP